jgi:hypothetical protein
MANDDRTKIIPRRTPESAAMTANVKRLSVAVIAIARLTFANIAADSGVPL